MNKKVAVAAAVLVGTAALAGCKSDSDVVSHNLSKDSDNYKIPRQIVVYNGITDKYILEVDGYCSLGNDDKASQVTYTCKVKGGYVKDIIERSDNSFVFVHQLDPAKVSKDHFKVIFKPSTVVPGVESR